MTDARRGRTPSLRRNLEDGFHSFVFALIPLLIFWTANVQQIAITAGDAARAAGSLLLANLLLLLPLARWRGLQSAAVTLSAFWVILSFYLSVRRGLPVHGISDGLWAAGWAVMSAAIAWWLGRPRPNDRRYVWLNTAALAAVGACLVLAAVSATRLIGTDWGDAAARTERTGPTPVRLPPAPPDIYYIVLDGLGRPDVLNERYGVDLEPELDELRRLGWTFAPASRTNYTQTYFSLASALNGAYLNSLEIMGDSRDRRAVWEVLQRSTPIAALKGHGYRFEMIGSNTSVTARHRQADACRCRWPGLNEFENGLLATTPFRALPIYGPTHGAQYRILHAAFDALEAPNDTREPRLLFAHIMAPHPPFVVGADGQPVDRRGPVIFQDADTYPGTRNDYRQGYADQVRWVMRRLAAFARTLAARDPNAIVIVHGDHGPGLSYSHRTLKDDGLQERLPIFMAMKLGEGVSIPEDLSPVNVWRVVFNARFGSNHRLLPNRHFYATWQQPYRFTEVNHMPTDARCTPALIETSRERERTRMSHAGPASKLRTDGDLTLWQADGGTVWTPPRAWGEHVARAFHVPKTGRWTEIDGWPRLEGRPEGPPPQVVARGDVVIDGGAHVGDSPRHALLLGAATVVAIEPDPDNLRALRRNLAKEIAAGRVKVVEKGIYDREGFLTFVRRDNSWDGEFHEEEHTLAPGSTSSLAPVSTRLPVTTIDRIVAELGLKRVDLIKLDIEGSEVPALRGAAETIRRFKPRIAVGTYHKPGDLAGVEAAIEAVRQDYMVTPSRCLPYRGRVFPNLLYFH